MVLLLASDFRTFVEFFLLHPAQVYIELYLKYIIKYNSIRLENILSGQVRTETLTLTILL